jgi:nicotinamidase-related amidase
MTSSVPAADPQHTALLVMDYQAAVVPRLPEDESTALVHRVAEAIATARRVGATVGYVRVGFTPEEVAAVPAGNKTFATLADRAQQLAADGPGTSVVCELAPLPSDIVVRKTRVGSFSTTDLHDQLSRRGITTLVLAGIATSGVVLSTVREAADLDYRLLVLADGCADRDQQVHDMLMEKVFPRQADVLSVADLGGLFGAGPKAA